MPSSLVKSKYLCLMRGAAPLTEEDFNRLGLGFKKPFEVTLALSIFRCVAENLSRRIPCLKEDIEAQDPDDRDLPYPHTVAKVQRVVEGLKSERGVDLDLLLACTFLQAKKLEVGAGNNWFFNTVTSLLGVPSLGRYTAIDSRPMDPNVVSSSAEELDKLEEATELDCVLAVDTLSVLMLDKYALGNFLRKAKDALRKHPFPGKLFDVTVAPIYNDTVEKLMEETYGKGTERYFFIPYLDDESKVRLLLIKNEKEVENELVNFFTEAFKNIRIPVGESSTINMDQFIRENARDEKYKSQPEHYFIDSFTARLIKAFQQKVDKVFIDVYNLGFSTTNAVFTDCTRHLRSRFHRRRGLFDDVLLSEVSFRLYEDNLKLLAEQHGYTYEKKVLEERTSESSLELDFGEIRFRGRGSVKYTVQVLTPKGDDSVAKTEEEYRQRSDDLV